MEIGKGHITCATYKKVHRFTIGSVGFYLVFSPVTFSFTTSPERPEGMRLSRLSRRPVCPCLALAMSLLLLAGLAGCGSAPSDNAPTLGSPASPAPLASENRNGSLPGKGTVSGGNSPHAAPASSAKPANPMDSLVIPDWIAKDLASADVDTRLRALETWVLIAPVGSIDPLILAFGNDDEQVWGRAMELIHQDWARAADRAL